MSVELVFNSSLRHHAFFISMLYLAHLRHGIGNLDNRRMRIPSRQDDMHHLWLVLQRFRHFYRIEHSVANGVIDFVEHHQIPFARLDCLLCFGPGLFDHPYIFRIGLLGADFYEAAPHLLHDEFVAESLDRVQLPVMPRALKKLQHEDAHPLPDSPQRRPHSSSGLTLAGTSIHDNETTAYI